MVTPLSSVVYRKVYYCKQHGSDKAISRTSFHNSICHIFHHQFCCPGPLQPTRAVLCACQKALALNQLCWQCYPTCQVVVAIEHMSPEKNPCVCAHSRLCVQPAHVFVVLSVSGQFVLSSLLLVVSHTQLDLFQSSSQEHCCKKQSILGSCLPPQQGMSMVVMLCCC